MTEALPDIPDKNLLAAQRAQDRFGGHIVNGTDGSVWLVNYTSGLGNRRSARFDDGHMTLGNPPVGRSSAIKADNDNEPVDPWSKAAAPSLPDGVLPRIIQDFAKVKSDIMGVDPGGLAMAALAVCAGAIPDDVKIQPKRHDTSWKESARIWVALVGQPSAKKSPVISEASRPLRKIDRVLYAKYIAAKVAYDSLSKDEKASAEVPRNARAILEDTTIEAAQEVFKDSPEGVLLLQDELSGWFGGMEKYSGGGRGAQKDRGFWLQSFNGGPYTVNRVGRGSSWIENLSASLLGGIQPELIRAVARDSHDDGLLQRLFPIVLKEARLGKDVPQPPVTQEYEVLIERLSLLRKPMGTLQEVPVRFDDDAQAVWEAVGKRNHELITAWENVNKKLSSAIGKYDGLLARLCLIWNCIESTGTRPNSVISGDIANRVKDFLYSFLLPHAVAFYSDILGASDHHDALLATAGWLLAHKPFRVTIRDIQRGDSTMRKMSKEQVQAVMERLEAFGWADPMLITRRGSLSWTIAPEVYDKFEIRALEEEDRRASIRRTIAATLSL